MCVCVHAVSIALQVIHKESQLHSFRDSETSKRADFVLSVRPACWAARNMTVITGAFSRTRTSTERFVPSISTVISSCTCNRT